MDTWSIRFVSHQLRFLIVRTDTTSLAQFTQAISNKRTDAWGGSVENRIKFGLGAIDAAVSVFGPEKVGIRLSPWGRFQDMLDDVSRLEAG